jgi:hypothetical protein
MISYVIFLVLALFIALTLKPLIQQVMIKRKHGEKVQTLYYPLLGLFKFLSRGYYEKGDVIHYKREALRRNPNTKLLVVNIME